MVIQYYGHSCFKISSGEITIAIDPYSKEIGLTPPRFSADILTVSHNHFDHNNKDSISGEPFIIENPGEYEIKGVFIKGIEADHDEKGGKERGKTTIFKFETEGIRICHFGDFGQEILKDEQLKDIGEIDILLIPVGGHFTIDSKGAAKVVHQLEPKIVIPMHFKTPQVKIKELAGVEPFLKEMGATKTVPQEKLTIKKKDLIEEKTQVVVLENRK